MSENGKCRGMADATVAIGNCSQCQRCEPDLPAGSMAIVPTWRAAYVGGVEVRSCDDRVPLESGLSVVHMTPPRPQAGRGNRIARVLGVLLLMAAASSAKAAVCGWPDPGADPYQGDQAAAVLRLAEVPQAEREQLADMVRQGYGWRRVLVTRDSADGGRLENLRAMNFGAGRICAGPVDRSMWPAGRHESGRAYAVGRWTVVTFDSCRNVALATDTHALLPPAPMTAQSLRDGVRSGGSGVLGFDGGAARTVPEPGSLALGLLAMLAALLASRRKGVLA